MTEEIHIPSNIDRKAKYELLIPQLKALVKGEDDTIANLANIIAGLKYGMDYFWVGLYRVSDDPAKRELILGPFQGPVSCTRIAFGKGVCGKAWEIGETTIVENVDEFPGHIACSSSSRSEIVVPVFKNSELVAVLDVDSTKLADFTIIDKKYLEQVSHILAGVL